MRSTAGLHLFCLCACLALSFVPFTVQALTEGDYTFTESGLNVTITGFNSSYSGALSITNSLGGHPVTGIEDFVFHSCSNLTSIIIPESVTNIGYAAFGWCDGLTNAVIGNSVTSIEDWAFNRSPSLACITIPKNVNTIGIGVFADCTSLTSILVDDGNQHYSSQGGVLFNLDKTTLIACPGGKPGVYSIPNSVTNIGSYAFFGCTNLTSVNIPESVSSIGRYAFIRCENLTSVNIPKSVSSIGCGAFLHCTSLASFVVDDGNRNYSSQDGVLFNLDKTTLILCSCGKSGSYTIPSSVTSIGNSAFHYCQKLTEIIIPESVMTLGDSAFESCDGLTSIAIPASVVSIPAGAFSYCRNLASVSLPNSVVNIGGSAFQDCFKLTSFAIPNSVTNTDKNCSNLLGNRKERNFSR